MLKKALMLFALTLALAGVTGQSFAHLPEPECLPCPEDIGR
jgi:hypothetical protein